MGSIDGEIPAVWFLISSIGFLILTFIQYRNTGKSFNTTFLSIMTIIFFVSYIILMIPRQNFVKGTKFQLKVWKYLKNIPKGKVKTYKQVAIGIKSPKSARAVANACAKNPYAPKIPCHRVIRSDGSLGGYSGRGGIKQKLRLLRSEKVLIQPIFQIIYAKKPHKINVF